MPHCPQQGTAVFGEIPRTPPVVLAGVGPSELILGESLLGHELYRQNSYLENSALHIREVVGRVG